MFDALKSMNLSDNTIVLFASDHGCHFKTRNDEYKRSCHESSVHIPCAAIGPGFNQMGKRDELISLVDLAPTLIDAAGMDIPEGMQGHSIIPSLTGESVFPASEQFIQISEDKVSRALRTKRWKYAVTAFDLDGNEQSFSDHYKEEFLYDLESDPFEQQNLIGIKQMESVSFHFREIMIKKISEIEHVDVTIECAEPKGEIGQRRIIPGEEMQ